MMSGASPWRWPINVHDGGHTVLRLFCLASACLLLATGTAWSDDWKFDVVHQTKGRPALRGLVVRQTSTDIHLRRVFRRPGQPTVVMDDRIPRSEVDRLELLKDDD